MAQNKRKIKAQGLTAQGRIKPRGVVDECGACGGQSAFPSFRFSKQSKSLKDVNSLDKNQLRDFLGSLSSMEKVDWRMIGTVKGLHYRSVKDGLCHPKPQEIPEDCNVSKFSFCREGRVYGYRVKGIFYIVWVDLEHKSMKA